MRSHHRTAAAVLLLLAGGLLGPGRASACGNAVNFENQHVNVVLTADRSLREGRFKEAVELLEKLRFPTHPSREKLLLRSRRIIAVALVRTDGLLPVADHTASTNEERRGQLAWAVQVLREADKNAPGTPVIRAALGEALARLPEHLQEAYDLLEGLARRDVLPSAPGYRALAQLRRLAGDAEGARAATEKAAALVKSPPPPELFPRPPRRPLFGRL